MTVSSTTDTSKSTYQSLIANTDTSKTSTTTTSKTEEAQTRFLKLLTTQLKNQDPMNPVDNAQTTSQLAQISTVDGIERLNSTLQGLVGSQRSSETLQAAALVGRGVLVDGNQLQLASNSEGSYAIGGFTLGADADTVKISIMDASGVEVASESLTDQEAGSHEFVWDGSTTNGAVAADGKYTIKITASKGKTAVDSSSLEMATVVSVSNGDNGVSLNAGRFSKLSLSDIRRII
ncbi:flagellar hook assembly protein FlgD [Uliginosibacterium sp. H3]|uniref:Basal-body rod modification protein FlgD n=1 Tax=Uliginosibacterium silvisoli TaxID=3114758 RepID=A0ABU6K6Q5_9RHOO|nr:flagellar hook assembly protein FlgD [Uliginosibacterium sp. H3]